ncbi:MAG: CCA tRNA nucleotidyltransferase [Chloroflexi bacterium]|nr:CCA tRNA nucleotidyltransferase [Chloroflexota bacterium]
MSRLPDDLNARLRGNLPKGVLPLLENAYLLATERGWSIYLVGGYVRDLLLGLPDYDLDMAVVGDAAALAEEVARQANLPFEVHDRFGTARLDISEHLHLDMVTARKESYDAPGALPTVEAGSIYDDLARRDFTINAMAIAISSRGVGDLLDPHAGVDDLRAGLIRVLHRGSFVDDPTRIMRAVRFAGRLGFKIEKATLELSLQAVRDGALATISTDRAVHELLLIMEEPKAGAMLAMLEKLGVLEAIYPGLTWPYAADRHMGPDESAKINRSERRDTYLAIIAAEYASDPGEAQQIASALGLTAPQVRLMRDAAQLAALWPRLGEEEQRPSELYALLRGLHIDALRAYARISALEADTVAWARLNHFIKSLRHAKTALNGDYLRALGVPPGPVYKEVLDRLLAAKLDGELTTRAEEERLVREVLRKGGFTVDI